MDFQRLTAPCGLLCSECIAYKAKSDSQIRSALSTRTGIKPEDAHCDGCRDNNGKCFLFKKNTILGDGDCILFEKNEGDCKIYSCTEAKEIHNCSECDDFPCDNLQPFADKANIVPHNTKVYNLCMIKKLGIDNWATNEAGKIWSEYFSKSFGS